MRDHRWQEMLSALCGASPPPPPRWAGPATRHVCHDRTEPDARDDAGPADEGKQHAAA